MTTLYVGVDPDFKSTAIAAFQILGDRGRVVFLGTIKSEQFDLCHITKEFHRQLGRFYDNWDMAWLHITIEDPQIYHGNSHARPMDISRLGQISGACAAAAAIHGTTKTIRMPTPQEWKGSVPKAIHQARILSRLNIAYTHPKSPDYVVPDTTTLGPPWTGHNKGDWKHLNDAIGLALWGMDQAELVSKYGIKADTGNLLR